MTTSLPNHDGLAWRPLRSDDIGPWFELIDRIERHDECTERERPSDLETLTKQSWVDLAADGRVGVDADGVFRAYARNDFRPGARETLAIRLTGGVDPDWRGRGIGRAMLEWQCARAVANVAELRAGDPVAAELPARMGSFVEEQITSQARLLEAAGFTTLRWFTELRRSLGERQNVAALDLDGLAVRPYDGDIGERVRQAHNDAFRDHWGSNPHSPEAWRTGVEEDEAFRPAMSYVIVDTAGPDQPVVAYAVNCEFEHDWAAQGFTEGYTEALGVRRAWRGRGLAKHLLELSAEAFAKAGHPYATLDVDSQNPTGAVALYESLGYRSVHRAAYYARDLS